MDSQQGTDDSFTGSSPERRIEDLTILYEVSRALQRTFEERKALHVILTGVTHGRGLGFNRAFILLIDPQGQHLEGRFAIGPSSPEEAARIWQELRGRHQSLTEILEQIPSQSGSDLQLNEAVARIRVPLSNTHDALIRLLHTKEACLAVAGAFQPHDLDVDPWLVQILRTDVFAVAPLHLAGKALGLLLADNAITRAPVSPASLKLLQIYAQAASAAIQNTRFYRQLMETIAAGEEINRKLRESQDHLLQAERLSTIGKMAAMLAHEIRTPLVSIGGFARRLLRLTPGEDLRREEMQIIVSEVTRLERMVEEVLCYARIAKPEYDATDVNDLIRGVVMTMQEIIDRKAIQAQMRLDPTLDPAMVDKFQIRQALMNLIDNALDAMRAGGTLTITSVRDGAFLEVGVIDTGIGIAREYWEKLFSPFFTTKSSGTGLGLAVASQIIENHGGSLRFESVPGQGSAFQIRLAFEPRDRSGKLDPNSAVSTQQG